MNLPSRIVLRGSRRARRILNIAGEERAGIIRGMRRGILILAVGAALGAGACVRPAQPTTPTAANVPDADLDAMWDATLSVLGRIEWRPDRQDRATGMIETVPATTKQIWEFWREDVADPYSQTLADLQTIQRKAIVRFRKVGEPKQWQVDVEVDVYRLQQPERQITSTSSGLEAFSSQLPTGEGQMLMRGSGNYLEPLGRDGAMEQKLLAMIMRQSNTYEYHPAEYPPTTIEVSEGG